MTPVVCVEGPSAVGKTRLATALADVAGAVVVPELAGGPPDGADPTAWFVAAHTAAYARARGLGTAAPLVVLDGDPFKGLWYHWVFAVAGAPAVNEVIALYTREVARGMLAFPDLYVVLGASEAELRERRAGDPTRSRRNFEVHLRLIAPQRRYFAALAAAAPGRVCWLDAAAGTDLVGPVLAAVAGLPARGLDAGHLLRHLAAWLATQPAGLQPPVA